MKSSRNYPVYTVNKLSLIHIYLTCEPTYEEADRMYHKK